MKGDSHVPFIFQIHVSDGEFPLLPQQGVQPENGMASGRYHPSMIVQSSAADLRRPAHA
jgi:hypothetical protein